MSLEAPQTLQDSSNDTALKSPGGATESDVTQIGSNPYPKQNALSVQDKPLSADFDTLLENSTRYIAILEAKVRRTSKAYAQSQNQLLDSELACHREAQNRLMFQRHYQLEQQRHFETAQKYQLLCQQHNKLRQDLQQDKNVLDIQKKLILEMESMIEIYQADYLPVQASPKNEFNPGAVDAPLPTIGFYNMITKQEPRSSDVAVDSDRRLKELIPKSPSATEPNNLKGLHDFGFITDTASFPQPTSAKEEMPALPAELKPPCDFELVMNSPNLHQSFVAKTGAMSLPVIEERDLEEHHKFEFAMGSSGTQFPTSALRDTPLPRTWLNGSQNNATVPLRSFEPTPASSNMASKRLTEQDEGKKRKRQRKPKPLAIAPLAKMT